MSVGISQSLQHRFQWKPYQTNAEHFTGEEYANQIGSGQRKQKRRKIRNVTSQPLKIKSKKLSKRKLE